jgi:hypothetical protein
MCTTPKAFPPEFRRDAVAVAVARKGQAPVAASANSGANRCTHR